MSDPIPDLNLPESFDGRVRLFPLPRLVLFPSVVQPLHIFEPRYCDMLHDAMLDDALITMATLREGWEPAAGKKPEISQVVCVCKVINHVPTDDRRHNIMVAGIQRARIIEEIDVLTAYRQAIVEPIDSFYNPERQDDRLDRRAMLVSAYRKAFPPLESVGSWLSELLESTFPLGPLTDVISFQLDFPLAMKEILLANPDIDARCDLLLKMLQNIQLAPEDLNGPPESGSTGKWRTNDDGEDYIPPFSVN